MIAATTELVHTSVFSALFNNGELFSTSVNRDIQEKAKSMYETLAEMKNLLAIK